VDIRCEDGNPCTHDVCDPTDGCLSEPLALGAKCSDGDPCTDNDRCVDGQCRGDEPDPSCECGKPSWADCRAIVDYHTLWSIAPEGAPIPADPTTGHPCLEVWEAELYPDENRCLPPVNDVCPDPEEDAACLVVFREINDEALTGLPEEPEADPDELAGEDGLYFQVPNPGARLSDVSFGMTRIGIAHQGAATVEEDGGLSQEEEDRREVWAGNGLRVRDCAEYVYEKYYDYSLFEDAIAGRVEDDPFITELAFGHPALSTSIAMRRLFTLELHSKNGNDLPQQDIRAPYGWIPCTDDNRDAYYDLEGLRNPFFLMPFTLFAEGSSERTLIQAGRYTSGYDYSLGPRPWEWHLQQRLAAQASGYSYAELDAAHEVITQFVQTLKEYNRYWRGQYLGGLYGTTKWGQCGGCRTPLLCMAGLGIPEARTCLGTPAQCASENACMQEWQNACGDYHASLLARLRELFQQANALGCLDLEAEFTVCDWSPRRFVEDLRALFDQAMEADYQRCLDLTEDDFLGNSLDALVFYLPDRYAPVSERETWNLPAVPPEVGVETSGGTQRYDFTLSHQALDGYFDSLPLYAAAVEKYWILYWENELELLPHDLITPYGVRMPGGAAGDDHEAGSELFGIAFSYGVTWGAESITDPDDSDTDAPLTPQGLRDCTAGIRAHAFAMLEGRAFYSEMEELFALYADGALTNDATLVAGLRVLGNDLFVPWETTVDDVVPNSPETETDGTKFYEAFSLFDAPPLPFSVAGISLVVEGGLGGVADYNYQHGAYYTTEWVKPDPVNPEDLGHCLYEAGYVQQLDPSVDVRAFASVAIDLIVISAGIRCDLVLLGMRLPIGLDLTLTQEEGDDVLNLHVGAGSRIILQALAGVVSAFVKIDFLLWEKTFSTDLFRWRGLQLGDRTLFGFDYAVRLSRLVDMIELGY